MRKEREMMKIDTKWNPFTVANGMDETIWCFNSEIENASTKRVSSDHGKKAGPFLGLHGEKYRPTPS